MAAFPVEIEIETRDRGGTELKRVDVRVNLEVAGVAMYICATGGGRR
jgi:hypothetical protein